MNSIKSGRNHLLQNNVNKIIPKPSASRYLNSENIYTLSRGKLKFIWGAVFAILSLWTHLGECSLQQRMQRMECRASAAVSGGGGLRRGPGRRAPPRADPRTCLIASARNGKSALFRWTWIWFASKNYGSEFIL